MHPQTNDIGAYIKCQGNVPPQSLSGTTAVNGAALDRQGYGSGVIIAQVGTATGSPTSFTATVKLQESNTTTSGDFTDVSGVSFVLDANSETSELDVDLAGLKQYIRVVITPAFVDGSSPTVPACASIVLGGADRLPAA